MTLNQIILIILAVIIIWWPIGGIINQRRSNKWLKWLESGVTEVGGASGRQWLRSFHSVAQLSITDLREPFRAFEVLYTLERRDNLVLYIISHLRGRRDEMIIQADLAGNPKQELEVGAHGRTSYDAYLDRQKENPFTQVGERDGFRIARRGEDDPWTIERLWSFLANQGKVILRMSVQRVSRMEDPMWPGRKDRNILLRASMTRMDAQSPAAFFAALREWASNIATDAGETEEQSPR